MEEPSELSEGSRRTPEERCLTNGQIEAYEQSLLFEEKSKATVEKYMRDIAAFRAWLGNRPVMKATVMAYKQHLVESRYAPRSVNSMLSAVNGLLEYLGWSDCRVKSLRLQREIFCPENKELTREEFKRLVETARRRGNERLEMILQTLGATGMRVSELSDVTVEAAKAGEVVVTLKGKTRRVFLVKELRKMLLNYARKHGITSGPIFITRTGRPLSRTNIWRDMKALCKEADVVPGKVFPHNLRHLFARLFYAMKADLAKLADILGHSSVDTTRIYIATTGVEHRRWMERLRLLLGT